MNRAKNISQSKDVAFLARIGNERAIWNLQEPKRLKLFLS